ncbi:MAG: cupin [Alteromonadaceae bacterium]|nr:MAG: cupin [Alteromonadaceae bacterium]
MAELDNIFKNLPRDLSDEVFQSIATGSGVKIERIISKGHASPAGYWYDQAQHEWVMLLAGEAMLAFESGREQHLKAGDYLNIPAHSKHRVLWTSAECETIWLAVHYD